MQVGNDFDTNSKMPEIAESVISRDEEDDNNDSRGNNLPDPSDPRL